MRPTYTAIMLHVEGRTNVIPSANLPHHIEGISVIGTRKSRQVAVNLCAVYERCIADNLGLVRTMQHCDEYMPSR